MHGIKIVIPVMLNESVAVFLRNSFNLGEPNDIFFTENILFSKVTLWETNLIVKLW